MTELDETQSSEQAGSDEQADDEQASDDEQAALAEPTQNPEQAFAEHVARLAAMTFPVAVAVGDHAPEFVLPNADGRPVHLRALLEAGPLVLVFYRGAWCPFCNTQLRNLQLAHDEIVELGGTIAAISPQTPDNSLALVEEGGLHFEVLSDVGSYVASDYGITFVLSEADRKLLTGAGNDLRKFNGTDAWMLPAPSTYVIAQDGSVAYARVDTNFTTRADPAEIVAVLRGLGAR